MTQSRLMWPSASAVYNQLHPDWRWEQLTSEETDVEAAKIEPLVAAIAALGFEFVRSESLQLRSQQQKGTPMGTATTSNALQVSRTEALNHASSMLVEAEQAGDSMTADSRIRIAQTWLSYVANMPADLTA